MMKGQGCKLFSCVRSGTLIMSQGNGTINLKHLEKESVTINLRQRENKMNH